MTRSSPQYRPRLGPLEGLRSLFSAPRLRARERRPISAARATHADVIVVGAGVAGLAAARAVQNAGRSVVVVEARPDRVGGRIWTDRSLDGAPIELGALWIHGNRNNPIYDLARQWRLPLRAMDYDAHTVYAPPNGELDEAEQDRIARLFDEVIWEARAQRSSLPGGDRSLQAAVDDVIRRRALSPWDRRALRYAIATEIEHDYAADIADLSLRHWNQDDAIEGDDYLLPNGFDAITNRLAEGLTIALGEPARLIDVSDTVARVVTPNATYTGRAVICSAPLGVMKSRQIAFSPDLPPRLQRSIDRLGVGLLNTVVVRFPRVFWNADHHLFGVVTAQPGAWNEFVDLSRLLDAPILCGFNAGAYARRLEWRSDREIVDEMMAVLRSVFGPHVPNPTGWRVSRWGADPFAMGSYSHLPVGATGDDYDTLTEPIHERLFLAGEATFRRQPGTAQGAYLSGERAARQAMAVVM
ncbi:MAG: FAD-dependent oxidoreductase [Dehalococcoidia bacterium]|nr:FAD-dependent oxidoreductase [Dehalococcoidia bacterium]